MAAPPLLYTPLRPHRDLPALHHAWNFYRFNSSYVVAGDEITQGETFNDVEGNGWIAITSFLAFLVVLSGFSRIERFGSSLHSREV